MASSESFTGTTKFWKVFHPDGEPEFLSGDGACSVTTFMTDLSGNRAMTLAAGQEGQMKLIQTAGGANATVTCALDQSSMAYVSFDLGANNKSKMIWTGSFWTIIESKGLTKNV